MSTAGICENNTEIRTEGAKIAIEHEDIKAVFPSWDRCVQV